MATLAGTIRVMNWIALPTVLLVVAAIFAGAVALDHRRQRAPHPIEEAE